MNIIAPTVKNKVATVAQGEVAFRFVPIGDNRERAAQAALCEKLSAFAAADEECKRKLNERRTLQNRRDDAIGQVITADVIDQTDDGGRTAGANQTKDGTDDSADQNVVQTATDFL